MHETMGTRRGHGLVAVTLLVPGCAFFVWWAGVDVLSATALIARDTDMRRTQVEVYVPHGSPLLHLPRMGRVLLLLDVTTSY